jgi:hypothetical protein
MLFRDLVTLTTSSFTDRSHAPAWECSLDRSCGVYGSRLVSGEHAVVDALAPRSGIKP